jgi:O-antigen ligase
MKKKNIKLLKYSLFFFFICAPLESISLGESFSLAKLTAIIVLLIWALIGFPMPKSKMLDAFYVLLGYAILSALWGIDISNSFNQILTFLIPSILVAVAMSSSINDKDDIALYMIGYVIGCVIAAMSGMYFRNSILNDAITNGQERLTAFGADQNALAFLLTMGIVCLLSYYSSGKSKKVRAVVLGGIGVFLLMILSTGSRTGLVMASIVIAGFLLSQRNFNVFFIFTILIIAAIPFLISYLPQSIIERFMETDQLVSSGNFSDRGDIWSRAIDALSHQNFVLGVGYSNFKTMFKISFGETWASHNTYLTYLAEFGVLGFFVFLYVLIVIWKYARKISKQSGNWFVYFYVIPYLIIMLTLETEYKRWIFILGIMLESWYNMSKKPNNLVK